MSVTCNNVNIFSKSNIKYLGVTLDQDMAGTSMGTSVVKKVNAKIEFQNRKGAFFGPKERKLLSSALIQSSFNYAYNSWY